MYNPFHSVLTKDFLTISFFKTHRERFRLAKTTLEYICTISKAQIET